MQYCLRSRWCLCALLVPLLCAHSLLQSPDLPDLNVQLVAAAADGDLAAVAHLLERGADVNADNGFGITALYTAADWGNLDLVTLLLEHGADPDSTPTARGRSPWGFTPLQLASATNTDVRVPEARAAIVELLVERGGGSAGEALVDLIRLGYYDAARTIVGRGEVRASYLNLALNVATRAGQAELVTLLTAAGARAPSPVDQTRAPERLELIVGVYRSGPAEALTLILGLDEGYLLLQRKGQPSVAVLGANRTLLRSADRNVIIELGGRTLPPTELTLYEAGESSVFGRTDEVPERLAVVEPTRRAVEPTSVTPTASSGEWPSFRGLRGSGVADGPPPPTSWDLEQSVNVVWKTPIPGIGHSSPVIWGDRVFVTTALALGDTETTFLLNAEVNRSGLLAYVKNDVPHAWRTYALDRRTGEVLWERVATEGAPPRTARHVMASDANQTPATDGTHVVAWFGSEGVYCYDLDGTLLWTKDLGDLDSGRYFDPGYEWNAASSPIIYEHLVILQVDVSDQAYLLALDVETGEEVWRTERDEHPSWPTPLIYEDAAGTQVVTAAVRYARGYAVETGEELWRLADHGDFPTPTPVAGRGLIFVASSGMIAPIYAIRPDARGDISLADDETSNDYIVWGRRRGGPGIPTPIFYGDLLYVISGGGILVAYQGETGEIVYRTRVTRGSNYSASPVAAGGKLYFSSEQGEVIVVKAGPEFERLAVNQMGEALMATPAITDGMIVFRMEHHVVAIAEQAPE